MPIQSSFATVAEQIASFNNNIVEVLSKINSLSTTTDPSVDVRIYDTNGVLNTYSLPSFTFLKSEIERLNNSINSLYSIDTTGALIQTTSQNQFKKIITVDLNTAPNPVTNLQVVSQFVSEKNFFLDNMLDPHLKVEFDLSNQIENSVRKCLIRRYIVEFAKDATGNYTSLGQSAITSFNSLYRQKNNIDIQEFINWHQTTPGIVNPLTPNYEETMFDLQPNTLLYDGVFNVIKIEEDTLNRKLFYHLNTLDYLVNETLQVQQLAVNNELIINQVVSNTRYKIIEISTTESNPRIRVERVEGLQPIPVGIGTLKIYSPVVYPKKLRVDIGYDERNVLFVKPVNADSNLVAKDWSKGTGYYTNDLKISSTDSTNGQTMQQYYTNTVYDYSEVLKDLVAKKTPNSMSATPNVPVLDGNNFKVVQINKHLTDTTDANLLKNKHNYSVSLKNEITQIQQAIDDRNKKLKITKFTSDAEKKKFSLEIDDLNNKKVSKSKLLTSTTQEIINLSRTNLAKSNPVYHLRGFWNIPEAVAVSGTQPQQVIQFRVQYRKISKDGKEPTVETFNIVQNNKQVTAAFSNWIEYKSEVRKRVYDKSTGVYTWQVEDITNADAPNINQVDIPIATNERIEFRVKSISEAGYPDSPVESDWSQILTVDFPDDLNNVLNDNDFILKEADKEDLKVSVQNDLNAKGLDVHLSETAVLNNKTYLHNSSSILSGFKDANGVAIDLYAYLVTLTNKITALEEKILRAKGELQIVLIRNNQEFVIGNNAETTFNVECEEYLDPFTGTGVPTGRVYANNIYVIKDFALRVTNKSVDSVLGLLSGKNYDTTNGDVYNSGVPQTFWVNNHDELIFNDVSGVSKTQVNNQFIWMVNYEAVTNNAQTVTRLSENIGNNFVASNNNSITNILSLNEYNVGYFENQSLAFKSSNNSLLDNSKWIDTTISVGSTTKFLTTIHPVVNEITDIVETNVDKVHSIVGGGEIVIPINIYFKMNALDNTQTGVNYEYVNLNQLTQTVKHIKKLKFYIENEADNKPFVFTLIFNLNRNKVTFASKPKNYSTIVK
jgi:hypothetical protein